MTDINWQDLAAPIPDNEVKTRPGRGRSGVLSYITSRVVMNRLDRVVGPNNWRDEYTETSRGVVCTLYIRIDGEWVGKSDIGVDSNVEEDKGAYSDAMKRAAVKWGIGRELYQEGTAFDDTPPPRVPERDNSRRIADKPARTSKPAAKRTQQEAAAVSGEADDPFSADESPFTSGKLDSMKLYMSTHDMAEHPAHAANIVMEALTAYQDGQELGWGAIFAAQYATSVVWAQVIANRATQAEVQA